MRTIGTADGLTSRQPETPLWEQWAEQRAQLPQGERLQKVLASTGWGSRRACEELIAAGRVTVNGEVAELGRRVIPSRRPDRGRRGAGGRQARARLLPAQQAARDVTTAKDTHGRPTVVELVPGEPRVFPVGRLDADTEGLLLLTNDGELAHRITHPSHGVEKEYLAHVRGRVPPGALRTLRDGVELDDGMTAPAAGVAAVARRAADHDPRGPQPPGAADVRGDRASRCCGWCAPGSARSATARCGQATGASSRPASARR